MFEVQILALIYREIEAINNRIEGSYLGRVRAPEPRQGSETFDLNSHQMVGRLVWRSNGGRIVARSVEILCNFELEGALMEGDGRRRRSRAA